MIKAASRFDIPKQIKEMGLPCSPNRHFTVRNARQRCSMSRQCNNWSCIFSIEKRIVSMYENKIFEMIGTVPDIQYWSIERISKTTDQKDNLDLNEIDLDDNNQETKFWSCLGKSCSKPVIFFLSQTSLILLIVFDSFWRSELSKICDQSTDFLGKLSSAVRYILASLILWTHIALRKLASLSQWSVTTFLRLAQKWNLSTENWQILLLNQHF